MAFTNFYHQISILANFDFQTGKNPGISQNPVTDVSFAAKSGAEKKLSLLDKG